eukprot:Nitzschia sp. Nitz4//scaffold381_size12975//6080//9943//NITZ4_008989-RA/size12975-processed-gene-0.5-mRNA-1//1//CDS//3329549901//5772//frame0
MSKLPELKSCVVDIGIAKTHRVIMLFFVTLLLVHASTEALTLNCDPCIDRTSYRIRAIVPRSSTSGSSSTVVDPLVQTADDMNVELDLVEADNDADIVTAIQATDPSAVDALVVSASSSAVVTSSILEFMKENPIETAVMEFMDENPDLPVFGWGWGYEKLANENTLGWIADDADTGGRLAAQELQRLMSESHNTTLESVAMLHSTPLSAATAARWNSFLDEQDGEENVGYDVVPIAVDSSDSASGISETKLHETFLGCPYQAILLADSAALEALIEARSLQGCDESTLIAVVFDDIDTTYNHMVYQAITRGQVAFGLNPQVHLQVTLASLMAAVYVSTGKVVSFPIETATYWSGPVLIDVENVPSDTSAECEQLSFPLCSSAGDVEVDDDGVTVGTSCSCTNRKSIRIGGVVHGPTTDAFWDPIFAAAEITANDMNVDLNMERFQLVESMSLIYEQMAARIRNLCDSGIDGLFATIPDDGVKAAVQRCHELRVPVVSINSGWSASEELELPHHIGQDDYAGGYGGAVQLINAGMKRGYCVDHAFGNAATKDRCEGFRAGIADSTEDVAFGAHVDVPSDNEEQYVINLEAAIEADGGWENVGLLGFGADRMPALLRVLEEHPGTVAGSFDTSDAIYESVRDGQLLFGIDQQPYLQGQLPIYLLTYMIYTQQALTNHVIQSGPSFVQEYPSEAQKVCEANFFAVCPDRPEEDMSYIPNSFIVFGYVLFGLLVWSCLVAFAWTCKYRSKWVVKVSQPLFLHLVVFGCLVSGLSILFMGVQTAYRNELDISGDLSDSDNPAIKKVDAACMAVPWLWGLGFVVTFSALFAKIHRVKLIYLAGLQMKRKQVSLADVLPVMAIMFVIEFAILLSWQFAAPLQWQREVMDELDGYPTVSVGSCDGGQMGWRFYAGLVAFHVCCLGYALVLCFQTKDINSDFAESSYVSLAVAFMFQVLVLAVPISALVRDSADTLYFVKAIATFLQNFTVLVLIFVPKMLKVHEEHYNPTARSQRATSLHRTPRPSGGVSWGASLTERSREIVRSDRSASFRADNEDSLEASARHSALQLSERSPVPSGAESSNGPSVTSNEIAQIYGRVGKFVLPDDIADWESLGFPFRAGAQLFRELLQNRSPQREASGSVSVNSDAAFDDTKMRDSELEVVHEEHQTDHDEKEEEEQMEQPSPTRVTRVNFVGAVDLNCG